MDKNQNIDISGFVIKGKKFTNKTQFSFWENEKLISLIYGLNAEGKSSICNIIREWFILENYNKEIEVDTLVKKNVENLEPKKNKFFIFNDDYIDRFINRGDKGLKPFFPDEGFYIFFEVEYNKIFEQLYLITKESKEEYPSILWTWNKMNSEIHKNYCMRYKRIYKFSSCIDKNNHLSVVKELLKNRSGYEDKESLEHKINVLQNEFEEKLKNVENVSISPTPQEINFQMAIYENWFNIYYLNTKISSLKRSYSSINYYISDFIGFIKNEKNNINNSAFAFHLKEIKYTCEALIPIFKSEYLEYVQEIDLHDINHWFIEDENNNLLTNVCVSLEKLNDALLEILKELENFPKDNEITELVNKGISYILRNDNYLKINYEANIHEANKNYVIVNGNKVEFLNLSTSEKNMLALVYFLASLWHHVNSSINQDDNTDGLNYIVMIDDPVSSFDQEYKENISNYFIYVINKIIKLTKNNKKNKKNISAKFVIFTHDINIYRLFKNNFKSVGDFANIVDYKRLSNNVLYENNKDVLVYSKTIRKIFNFITLEEQNEYTNIGNDVRRVLEFFLLHYRNKVFNDIQDNELKNEFYEKKHEKLFDTIKFRNLTKLLHIESHENENLFNMNFNYLREPEYYKNLAKELFCFIHVIDDRHIVSHLKYREKCKCDDNIKCKDCKCNFKCDSECECKEKCKSKTKKSEYIKKEELDSMINGWIQNLELMSLKEEEIEQHNILFSQKSKSFN